jgi:hypothetical protein
MDYERLFQLAKPSLEQNDLGAGHTSRVLAIARKTFSIPKEIEDLTIASIILHDIGGASIKDQYEKGPTIAKTILNEIGCGDQFIQMVTTIVESHHDHPDKPSEPFKILYDSDKLVMFSPEEFPIYDSRRDFDWKKIIDLIYSEDGKDLAKALLRQRRSEKK